MFRGSSSALTKCCWEIIFVGNQADCCKNSSPALLYFLFEDFHYLPRCFTDTMLSWQYCETGSSLPHGMIHQAVRMTSLFIIHLKQPKPSCLVPKPLLTVNTVWGSICDRTKTFRRVWVEQNFEPCTEHMRKLKCVSSNSRGCMNWTGI